MNTVSYPYTMCSSCISSDLSNSSGVVANLGDFTHVMSQPCIWSTTEPVVPTPSARKARNTRNKKAQLWRCENGHQWTASLHALKRNMACPKCFPANTSQAEQTLFRHITRVFESTQNRADVCYRGKPVELDIFVPDIMLAIEYDGYHHRNRRHKDEEQNYVINQLGIQLIRVRALGLPQLPSTKTMVLHHDTHDQWGLQACLSSIGAYMKRHYRLTTAQIQTIDAWDD